MPVFATVISPHNFVYDVDVVRDVLWMVCAFLPPPPLAVPVVCVPSAAKKILPLATSDALAVVGVTSTKDAVPPPVFGNLTDGTALYDAPHNEIFCAISSPN